MKRYKVIHVASALGLLVTAAAFVAPLPAGEPKPIAAEAPSPQVARPEAAPGVAWRHAFQEAREQAAKVKKPLLLDFYADG